MLDFLVIYIDMKPTIVVNNFFWFFKIKNNNVVSLEMTYMFENPTYIPITMPPNIQVLYRRYGLYSYCEGIRCEAHRRNQFSGI